MKYGKVAVIVLNWNGIRDTIDCISSLQESTWRNYSVYVVDNGSLGNEGDIIASKFPSVKVLMLQENLGFCRGNNIAIIEAIKEQAELILMLNNDTVVPPDLICEMVNGFEKLPDAGAVSPLILDYPNDNNRVQFSGAKWISKKAAFSLTSAGKDYAALSAGVPYESEFASGCCMLTTAVILEEVGLLDERYFAYYDDADWCRRLTQRGYKSYVIPGTSVYHRFSRDNKITPVAFYLLGRNRLLWMRDHLSWRQILRACPALFKELFIHIFNITGLNGSVDFAKQESRGLVRGFCDFFYGRFGKWGRKTGKLLFQKK